jgi:hypothetical protein
MERQAEMPGIDNELSGAANRFVDILEEQQELNERKNKAALELVEAMKASGKGSVRHRGRTLALEEIEATVKIKVSKFQDTKKKAE